ncbi:MAG: adenosine deaminase [Deltaproteobacteria bacterium]|nr:adenosine deaminase [Deltaproteobacteria bacterium]
MTQNAIRSLPKIELHRHLEGSIPLDTVLKWHKTYGLPLPPGNPKLAMQATEPMPFAKVLDRLRFQQQCFQNLESVEQLAYEVLKTISEDQIKMIELRFSPAFMAEPQQLSFQGIMEAMLTAQERAEKDFDLQVGYLLISSRDYGQEACQQTIDLALHWKNEIVGIDLAGDELRFPLTLFEKPFLKAHEAGLKITVHAAEVGTATEIKTAIHQLKARRIGHGVQAHQDPHMQRLLMEQKIPLELCPTSNVMTQAVAALSAHPIKKLMAAGVLVTVNSDDPTLFNTSLSEEYLHCINDLNFTIADLKKTILTAYHHSFLPEWKKKKAWNQHFKYLAGC